MGKKERIKTGKDANEKGRLLEKKAAEIYRMLGFEVQTDVLIGGRQIDLVLRQKIGTMIISFIVECKFHQVTMREVNIFQVSLNIAKQEDPRYLGIMVSETGFARNCREAAKGLGITCVLFSDLVRSLIDFTAYVKHLVEDFENSELFRLFIEPCVRREEKEETEKAGEFLDQWLFWPKALQITLLGDYGTGKTTLARKLAHDMGKKHLEDASRPVPVLVNLRETRSSLGLENLVIHHLQANGIDRASFKAFRHLLEQGFIVLIFDGFDEMVTRTNARQTLDNLRELNRAVSGKAKVMLTCRTHYFRDIEEEKRLVKGERSVGLSEGSTNLYHEIFNRPDFKIVYLQEFTEDQVKEYFNKIYGESGPENYRIMTGIYNLGKLSKRPVLLDMIIKSLGRMAPGKETLRPAELYDTYTRIWIDRDDWRSVLTPEQKIVFVEELAFLLWEGEKDSIHYRELNEVLISHFKETIQQAMELEFADYEVRTATFLQRDPDGNYRFSHRSFLEFFLARRIIRCFPDQGPAALALRRLSPEILGFLSDLIIDKKKEWLNGLGHILTRAYLHRTSENAFLLLVAFRRKLEPGKPVRLPKGIKLPGIRLAFYDLQYIILTQADLKGANLRGVNLADSDLSDSNLSGSVLEIADLTGTNLSNALLSRVDLYSARLEGASLCGADLEDANLNSAYLVRADFSRACIKNARFNNTALKEAKGLEQLRKKIPPGASLGENLQALRTEVVRGHNGWVNSVCFSPDGRLLASASADNTVRLWDVEKGVLIKTLEGHSDIVNGVCFSSDSRLLASASADNTVMLWDVADVEKGTLIKTLEGHSGRVYGVCFSSGSRLLASASADNTVMLWDVADVEKGTLIKTLEGHSGRVYGVCFSSDSRLLASASADNTVMLWDVADVEKGVLIKTLEGHLDIVNGVCFSSDSRLLASASDDKTVMLWDVADVEKGVLIKTLEGHSGRVYGFCFSSYNRLVASASSDNTVKVWDVKTGKCLVTLVAFIDNSWLTYTPENFFTCSDAAVSIIKFKENAAVYPAKEFEKELRRPDKVKEALAKAG